MNCENNRVMVQYHHTVIFLHTGFQHKIKGEDMYCTECGKKLPDGSLFCPECGTVVKMNSRPADVAGAVVSAEAPAAAPEDAPENAQLQETPAAETVTAEPAITPEKPAAEAAAETQITGGHQENYSANYAVDTEPQKDRTGFGLCVAGFIISAAGFLFSIIFLLLAAGLILSGIGVAVTGKNPPGERAGRGLGIAGIVIAVLGIVIRIFFYSVLIALV